MVSRNKQLGIGGGSGAAEKARKKNSYKRSRWLNWLPNGWYIGLEVVDDDGSKRKYYTDPVTGKVFRNIRDATENIETGELGKYLSGHRRKSIRKRYSVRVESHFYSDPVEGNVFRKDASDYIETGKLVKYASGPRRKYIRGRSTLREESPPPILVDELKSLSTSRN